MRLEAAIRSRLIKTIMKLLDLLTELFFTTDISSRLFQLTSDLRIVYLLSMALEDVGHLTGDHRVDRDHIGPHCIQLPNGPENVVSQRSIRIHGVEDLDFIGTLAMAVDTTIALLHHVGVVGDLDMDHPTTIIL